MCTKCFSGTFSIFFPLIVLMCFHMVRVLLSYIYQPFILFIVILTITLSIFLPLISKVRVFLLPTCVSNLSSFQSQTDGRHKFGKEGKRRKKRKFLKRTAFTYQFPHSFLTVRPNSYFRIRRDCAMIFTQIHYCVLTTRLNKLPQINKSSAFGG